MRVQEDARNIMSEGIPLARDGSPKLPDSASGASSRSEDSEYLPYVQWLGATVGWSSLHLIISTAKPMNQRLETFCNGNDIPGTLKYPGVICMRIW